MKKLTLLLVALVASVASYAADLVTVIFTVDPQMHCENCENKIKKNLRFEKGVKDVEASAADQIVTVKYDPEKTNEEALIQGFEKIGYTATVAKEAPAKSTCKGSCCGSGHCTDK
ncbi:MAG: heavy-metal-associated domain-containing protein [Bacteroidales bacterium]|nr:heavy-metal-associated domain-containing protein [Bacteroidales bacterium]